MTQDPNMMYESTYGPYHVHTWYIHLYALKGYTGVYTCIYTCAYNMYIHIYFYRGLVTSWTSNGLGAQRAPKSSWGSNTQYGSFKGLDL